MHTTQADWRLNAACRSQCSSDASIFACAKRELLVDSAASAIMDEEEHTNIRGSVLSCSPVQASESVVQK
jgi:hypothetical protein